ncbi:helix-turn-helix domain-containing protein [Bradyrhizobium prioriisuperbiae]|uniref:helix-turn-helix domain-containing protein n=1 Tax=Bradyrhizobium prioriisuperbiae TaxID=2854389 RepID=UPI0038994B3C
MPDLRSAILHHRMARFGEGGPAVPDTPIRGANARKTEQVTRWAPKPILPKLKKSAPSPISGSVTNEAMSLAHAIIDGRQPESDDPIEIGANSSLRMADVQRVVIRYFQASRNEFFSHRRNSPIVRARQLSMFLCREKTMRSLPEIGRRHGGRDHTTVLHACRKIADLERRDVGLVRQQLADLRAILSMRR